MDVSPHDHESNRRTARQAPVKPKYDHCQSCHAITMGRRSLGLCRHCDAGAAGKEMPTCADADHAKPGETVTPDIISAGRSTVTIASTRLLRLRAKSLADRRQRVQRR